MSVRRIPVPEEVPNPFKSGRYSRGFRPHIRAEGRPYFVTFRLDDTLPQTVLQQYQTEREELLRLAELQGRELNWHEQVRLLELYSEKIEAYLDAGYGECWLRNSQIARRLQDALRFFNCVRYDLSAWVVMPNHVHAIVRPIGIHVLHEIVKSWKGFTAREANKVLNGVGQTFWHGEYYDHVIRDDAEKHRLAHYIHDNPVKAGLCARPKDWRWSSAGTA